MPNEFIGYASTTNANSGYLTIDSSNQFVCMNENRIIKERTEEAFIADDNEIAEPTLYPLYAFIHLDIEQNVNTTKDKMPDNYRIYAKNEKALKRLLHKMVEKGMVKFQTTGMVKS